VIDPEIKIMSDQFQPPPYVYDGLDPVREKKSIFAEAAEVTNGVVAYIGDAIERGRKPGMPLSILSNVTREAPLGSLLLAFLLGVMDSGLSPAGCPGMTGDDGDRFNCQTANTQTGFETVIASQRVTRMRAR